MLPRLESRLVDATQRAEADDTNAAERVEPTVVRKPEVSSDELLVPGELLLGSLSDPRLHIVSPILVRLFLEHDSVVAEAIELNEFGYGENISEAVRDIQRAIAQLYFSLEESSAHLGPDLVSTWSALQRMVTRVQLLA